MPKTPAFAMVPLKNQKLQKKKLFMQQTKRTPDPFYTSEAGRAYSIQAPGPFVSTSPRSKNLHYRFHRQIDTGIDQFQ
jgi:hypothetical protein